MIFNIHSKIVGRHAFLSPSKHHWTNYDDQKLELTYRNSLASQRGVELHAFAHDAIRLGIRLPETQETLNLYVNDAIDYQMTPEQVLYVSDNAFGTADAISFRDGLLRIHDLKTGDTPASIRQLEIYAAFFCMEYRYDPSDLAIELRIYQSDDVDVHIPDPNLIVAIMGKIVMFDRLITGFRSENGM